MEQTLFNFILEIPRVISLFGTWLVSPISEKYLNISPLGLLGIGGVSFIVILISVHVVRLFV